MVERLNPNDAILDNSFIILKYNGFSDRAPCTNLHIGEQKDRTMTLAEFPDHILNDYMCKTTPLWAFSRLQNDENSLRGDSCSLTLTSAQSLQSFQQKWSNTVVIKQAWNIKYGSQFSVASFECFNSDCFLTFWRPPSLEGRHFGTQIWPPWRHTICSSTGRKPSIE